MTLRRGTAAAALLLILLLAPPLLANGGTVRISRAPVGRYLVSVFSSPTPLRTGEVDISVLVQDASGEVVPDADVEVIASPVAVDSTATATSSRHRATRQQATNKLFQAAKFRVEAVGEWEFTTRVGGPDGGEVSFRATLTEPTLLDRPYLLAALILVPLGLLGWLFTRGGDEPEGPATTAA